MNRSFECKRCSESFNRKEHLQKHLNRKGICAPTKGEISRAFLLYELLPQHSGKKFDCDYCHKTFNSSSNRCDHNKICKMNPNNINTDELSEIDMLKQQVLDLTAQLQKYTQPQQTTVQQTIINFNTHVDFVYDVPIDHVDPEYIRSCLPLKDEGITNLIHAIYFSNTNPILRIKPKTHGMIEAFNGNGLL